MPSMFQLHITNYYAEIIFLFGEFKFAFNVIFSDITTHTSQTYSTKKTNKSKNNKKYSVCAVVSALACLFGAKNIVVVVCEGGICFYCTKTFHYLKAILHVH